MLSQWLTVISGLVPGGLIYLPQVTAAGLQGWGTRPAMCRVQWVSPLLALLGRQGRLGIVVLRVSLGVPVTCWPPGMQVGVRPRRWSVTGTEHSSRCYVCPMVLDLTFSLTGFSISSILSSSYEISSYMSFILLLFFFFFILSKQDYSMGM